MLHHFACERCSCSGCQRSSSGARVCCFWSRLRSSSTNWLFELCCLLPCLVYSVCTFGCFSLVSASLRMLHLNLDRHSECLQPSSRVTQDQLASPFWRTLPISQRLHPFHALCSHLNFLYLRSSHQNRSIQTAIHLSSSMTLATSMRGWSLHSWCRTSASPLTIISLPSSFV